MKKMRMDADYFAPTILERMIEKVRTLMQAL